MTTPYPGQRLSYDGARCTVHYYGPVEGTMGEWIGVEWDDAGRGKHNGSHQGKDYFKCLSDSPTAASFIRPTRSSDKPLSFLDALRKKYASSDSNDGTALSEEQINISGKTVEEVGFEKIRQQQATLQELRIVILDGLCIASVERQDEARMLDESLEIRAQGLRIVELDLSGNLLEEWTHVVCICSAVGKTLRVLKLDGNIFRDLAQPTLPEWIDPFHSIKDLSLRESHFSWHDILNLLPSFPSLETLRLSCNGLGRIPGPLPAPKLKELDLSSNKITSLRELGSLASLPALVNLSLRDNPIKTLETDTAFPATTFLDLKSTLPTNLSSLDPIPTTFPSLTRLLTANTPLTTIPSAKLLTIARLPTLTELNWAPITAAERQNAELYYLSTIVKELTAATNTREEKQILSEHPRWDSLCKIHGVPDLPKKPSIAEDEATAGTLAARVTKFTFYMAVADLRTAHKRVPLCNSSAQADDLSYPTADKNSNLIEKSKLIPRTVDVYRLKGIVGRLFSIQPMSCKLIWETGEWDPVGGREEDEGWSVSEDDESERGEERGATMQAPRGRDRSRWERREMELVDGTREVGFWVEGKTARVRVEPRYSY